MRTAKLEQMKNNNSFTIKTKSDLIRLVKEWGFLPFFMNEIEGFSIEEHVDPDIWFTDNPGPWEWKGPVIRETGYAYGKFFKKKVAFISAEWFYDKPETDGELPKGW